MKDGMYEADEYQPTGYPQLVEKVKPKTPRVSSRKVLISALGTIAACYAISFWLT